jgi:hypothetical protein
LGSQARLTITSAGVSGVEELEVIGTSN